MDFETAAQKLPQYTTGDLGREESLAISLLLTQSPALMEELRQVLELREALEQGAPEPPPFSRAVYQNPQRKPLVPHELKQSLNTLKQVRDLTGSVLKLAFKLVE